MIIKEERIDHEDSPGMHMPQTSSTSVKKLPMIKRLIYGIIISSLVLILPVLGNTGILRAPHVWILLVFGVLASVFQPVYNPLTITVKPKDKGTGAQIIWSVYVTQLAAILESAYLRYPRSVEWDLVTTVALAIMILGLSLRTWAVSTLGNLFTMHISLQADHAIIRKGPYSIMRHPSYLGAFMLYMFTTVFLHAWIAAIAAMILLPIAFGRRIHHEEEVLNEEFGQEYKSYCSEVKKLIPGIW